MLPPSWPSPLLPVHAAMPQRFGLGVRRSSSRTRHTREQTLAGQGVASAQGSASSSRQELPLSQPVAAPLGRVRSGGSGVLGRVRTASGSRHSETRLDASPGGSVDALSDAALARRLQAEEEDRVARGLASVPVRSADAELAALLQQQEELAAAAARSSTRRATSSATHASWGAATAEAAAANAETASISPLQAAMDSIHRMRSDAELAQRLQEEEELSQGLRHAEQQRLAASMGDVPHTPQRAGDASSAAGAPGTGTQTLLAYVGDVAGVVADKARSLYSRRVPSMSECFGRGVQCLQIVSAIMVGPAGAGPPGAGGAGMQAVVGCFSGLQLAACMGCSQHGLCFCALFGGCMGAVSAVGQNPNPRGGWRFFGAPRQRERAGFDADSDSDWDSDSEEQRGLNEETIDARTVSHNYEAGPSGGAGSTDGVEAGQCMICMEAFAVGDALRTLPCLHRYHLPCADEWLRRSPECPICKRDITEDMPLPCAPPPPRRGVRALGARLVRASTRRAS